MQAIPHLQTETFNFCRYALPKYPKDGLVINLALKLFNLAIIEHRVSIRQQATQKRKLVFVYILKRRRPIQSMRSARQYITIL